MKITKTFSIETLEHRKDGGRIVISTPSVDRDRDRVMPGGAQIDNYMRNPVVQWGHQYDAPWTTIGKTTALQISPEGIIAEFELRPAANDADPQNIVRLLWEGGWIRSASVGFIPSDASPNSVGGMDFNQWQLLEFSLVPIPANQDAIRLAMKAIGEDEPEQFSTSTDVVFPTFEKWIETDGIPVLKRGRVLSSKNESELRAAYESIGRVLSQLEQAPEQEQESAQPQADAVEPVVMDKGENESESGGVVVEAGTGVDVGVKADEAEDFEQELAAELMAVVELMKGIRL